MGRAAAASSASAARRGLLGIASVASPGCVHTDRKIDARGAILPLVAAAIEKGVVFERRIGVFQNMVRDPVRASRAGIRDDEGGEARDGPVRRRCRPHEIVAAGRDGAEAEPRISRDQTL